MESALSTFLGFTMTITVIAQDGAGEGAQAQRYQVTIAFLFPQETTVLALPHNPERWDTERAARWTPRNAAGAEVDTSDWEGNEPVRVPIEFVTTSQGIGSAELEVRLLNLEELPFVVRPPAIEPPIVNVNMGLHEYRGSITRVRVTRERVDEQGAAEIARVALELLINPKRTLGVRRVLGQ